MKRRFTTCCSTSEQTTLRPPTWTSMGLARILRASASMALGKVAENMTVWRSGRTLSTIRITWERDQMATRCYWILSITFFFLFRVFHNNHNNNNNNTFNIYGLLDFIFIGKLVQLDRRTGKQRWWHAATGYRLDSNTGRYWAFYSTFSTWWATKELFWGVQVFMPLSGSQHHLTHQNERLFKDCPGPILSNESTQLNLGWDTRRTI